MRAQNMPSREVEVQIRKPSMKGPNGNGSAGGMSGMHH